MLNVKIPCSCTTPVVNLKCFAKLCIKYHLFGVNSAFRIHCFIHTGPNVQHYMMRWRTKSFNAPKLQLKYKMNAIVFTITKWNGHGTCTAFTLARKNRKVLSVPSCVFVSTFYSHGDGTQSQTHTHITLRHKSSNFIKFSNNSQRAHSHTRQYANTKLYSFIVIAYMHN